MKKTMELFAKYLDNYAKMMYTDPEVVLWQTKNFILANSKINLTRHPLNIFM